MKNLAQSIPAKYRTGIYSILATLVGLEAIFDIVPAGIETKIMAALVVLGFGVAVGNVSTPLPPPPHLPLVEPNYPDEFA